MSYNRHPNSYSKPCNIVTTSPYFQFNSQQNDIQSKKSLKATFSKNTNNNSSGIERKNRNTTQHVDSRHPVQNKKKTEHIAQPDYNKYLLTSKGKRPSEFNSNRKAERNVLSPYYGVIPYENLYIDVYHAAHAYAKLLCELNGVFSQKIEVNSSRAFNLGCAVIYNPKTDERKLLFVPSGLRKKNRFIHTDYAFNENLSNSYQTQNTQIQTLKKLMAENKFVEVLHYVDFASQHYIEKNFRNSQNYTYGCSEPILYDECEKFCKDNPDYTIEGTAEFRMKIYLDTNEKLTLIDFCPQESCVPQCEKHNSEGYYQNARNRKTRELSPVKARPIGESFEDRLTHYKNLMIDYKMKVEQKEKEIQDLENSKTKINDELNKLMQLDKELKISISDFDSQIKLYEKEINQCDLQIAELDNELATINALIEEYTSEINTCQAKMKNFNEESEVKYHDYHLKQIQVLEPQVFLVKTNLEGLIDDHNLNEKKLKECCLALNKNLEMKMIINTKMKEVKQEIQNISNQILNNKEKLKQLRSINVTQSNQFILYSEELIQSQIAQQNNLIAKSISYENELNLLNMDTMKQQNEKFALKAMCTERRETAIQYYENHYLPLIKRLDTLNYSICAPRKVNEEASLKWNTHANFLNKLLPEVDHAKLIQKKVEAEYTVIKKRKNNQEGQITELKKAKNDNKDVLGELPNKIKDYSQQDKKYGNIIQKNESELKNFNFFIEQNNIRNKEYGNILSTLKLTKK